MTKLVWLDAGHGGTDPGAVGNGLQEKNIVLNITNRCGAYLLANYDVSVRYSRTTDVFVTLAERARLANNAKADAFVSMHLNAFSNTQANGFESYVTNTNLTAGSTDLQRAVHNALWDFYRQNGIQSNRGMKSLNLAVLRDTNMPAILTENLFISNAEILKFNDASFLQGVAEAHAEGIASYLKLTKKSNSNNSNGQTTHIVKGGETLSSIAKQYNTTIDAIAKANDIKDVNKILTGTVLTIPTSSNSSNSNNNNTNNNAKTHVVSRAMQGFTTAADALNGRNPRTTVQPGTYHVFNTSQGMINVTTKQGTAGSWINPNATSTAPTVQFFPATRTVGGGLVDTLNSIKVDSSFANRQRIATANGISNYTGTAAQNNQMLSLLNNGRLVRP